MMLRSRPRSLAAKTGLPVIHLDVHFWRPGWVEPPEDEWRDKQRGLLASEAWIVDGNYFGKLGDRVIAQADTAVCLELPLRVTLPRAVMRTASRLVQRSLPIVTTPTSASASTT